LNQHESKLNLAVNFYCRCL